jgi:mannitol/fructose-specific phosphotransferase system IIA component (Ntr-type)
MRSVLSRPVIDLDCIDLEMQARDGAGAIRELHEQVCAARAVRAPALLLDDLLARHRVGSSCLDQEVALPHTRTLAVDDFVFGVGRSAHGMIFDSEHRSIRLVVLVAAPAGAVQEYLQFTVELARRLRDPQLRRQLHEAATPAEFKTIWAAVAPG